VNPHEKPAQRVQVCLMFQTVHQNRKCWFDRRIAEILQSGSAARLGTKLLTLQRAKSTAQVVP
jgi:hypothetical protein